MSLSGALSGVLGLAALEVGLSSPRLVHALGTVGTGASAFVNRLINPKVGLIPNAHDSGAPTAASAAAAANSAQRSADETVVEETFNKVIKQLPQKVRMVKPGIGRPPLIAPPVSSTGGTQ